MTLDVQIVVFDGADEIDVFGPLEILAHAGITVALAAAERPGRITSKRGVRLDIDQTLGGADGIIVPGGGWLDRGAFAEAERGRLPARLAELAPDVRWLASVCTGGMLLARTGLLEGPDATTNRACFPELRPYVGTVVDERVVDAGDRITSGALFAGVDVALHLVDRELGTAAADRVAHTVEYHRHGRTWHSSPVP